jgi:AcrR family transcriptional regulator
MRKRADDMERTRQRIIEAAVDLHGSLGPAATTIAAIAAKAGVTRLTVYRHFPEPDSLFTACTQHWMAAQDLPDPDAWEQIADPLQRARAALADLYRFYAAGEPMLTRVYRDWDSLPDPPRIALTQFSARHRDALLAGFPAREAVGHRRLRAAIAHAVSYPTWRSLCLEQDLPASDATGLLTAMIAAASDTSSNDPAIRSRRS